MKHKRLCHKNHNIEAFLPRSSVDDELAELEDEAVPEDVTLFDQSESILLSLMIFYDP